MAHRLRLTPHGVLVCLCACVHFSTTTENKVRGDSVHPWLLVVVVLSSYHRTWMMDEVGAGGAIHPLVGGSLRVKTGGGFHPLPGTGQKSQIHTTAHHLQGTLVLLLSVR